MQEAIFYCSHINYYGDWKICHNKFYYSDLYYCKRKGCKCHINHAGHSCYGDILISAKGGTPSIGKKKNQFFLFGKKAFHQCISTLSLSPLCDQKIRSSSSHRLPPTAPSPPHLAGKPLPSFSLSFTIHLSFSLDPSLCFYD